MLGCVHEDFERCVRAVQGKDARFDGWFYTAVVTTRIYCRPSCPVVPPKPRNMTFYPSAAAAQQAGFRACKRCRPDASPGSPQWNERADLVARAMRLIADGVVDTEGVRGLAARLGYSVRQVERQLLAELGAGPLALARAQRAQTARTLIETTTLPMTELALAAGFGSIRTFNDTVREVFALSPTELRARREGQTVGRGRGDRPAAAATGSRCARTTCSGTSRPPACRASRSGGTAPTAARCGCRTATASSRCGPKTGHIACRLTLTDLRDLPSAISRCRRLLDLDADPVAVDDQLAADPLLAPLVAAAPGRRVPRTVDGAEFAVRAVLGQQVSTAAARTHAARLVVAHGEPVDDPEGGLTHLFPSPEALASLDPETLAMPRSRRRTLLALVEALAGGLDLGAGSDWAGTRAALDALPGFGPWTVEIIAMRALGDPDAFLPTDLGIKYAAETLGLGGQAAVVTRSAAWRPWRAYAVQHLWATGDHAINRMPAA